MIKTFKLYLTEAVGRQYQHIEDQIIINGSSGALAMLDDISDVLSGEDKVTTKWDGNVAIYWGRDKNGNFILLPQYQWKKKTITSLPELEQDIINTGRKSDLDDEKTFKAKRQELANNYKKLWPIFEKATSETLRGIYFKGDILFDTPPAKEKSGDYTFTPNKVTYHVRPDGLGNKISSAEVMVVVHGSVNKLGDDTIDDIDAKFVDALNNSPNLIVIGPTPITINPVNIPLLAKTKSFISSNRVKIDYISNFANNIKQALYSYSIALGKDGSVKFDDWLESSGVSEKAKTMFSELQIDHEDQWNTFWAAYNLIQQLKSVVLKELLNKDRDYNSLGVRSTTGNKPGGEGFVTSKLNKLINPEFRSSASNERFN